MWGAKRVWTRLRSVFSRSRKARAGVRGVLEDARLTRIPRSKRGEIMRELQRRVSDSPKFFEKLPKASIHASYSVRKFSFGGHDVAVKDCGSTHPEKQGFDYGKYGQAYRWYRAAAKNQEIRPEKYVLVRLRPFGSFTGGPENRRYLVMELLKARNSRDMAGLPEGVGDAYDELNEHVRKLSDKHRVRFPQVLDALILGNTNPENPGAGKWVFAWPHDYW